VLDPNRRRTVNLHAMNSLRRAHEIEVFCHDQSQPPGRKAFDQGNIPVWQGGWSGAVLRYHFRMTATATVSAVSRIRELSPAEVRDAMERGEIVLIDVREPAEHAGERIPGSRLLPLSKFDADQARSLAGGKPIVLHCRGGNRSGQACQKMLNAGAEGATHLAGGIEAWNKAGLPIERDAKAPISIMRQVQITAGSLVLIGAVLGYFVSPWFIGLSGFVGAGLLFAGLTDTCGMAMLLAKMPWNRV